MSIYAVINAMQEAIECVEDPSIEVAGTLEGFLTNDKGFLVVDEGSNEYIVTVKKR